MILLFAAEDDLTRLRIHRFNDCKRLNAVTLFTQGITAALEALFNDDAAAGNRSACFLNNRNQTVQRIALRQKIVNDQYTVVGGQIILRHNDIIDLLCVKDATFAQ